MASERCHHARMKGRLRGPVEKPGEARDEVVEDGKRDASVEHGAELETRPCSARGARKPSPGDVK
jgi:hypothetical protein